MNGDDLSGMSDASPVAAVGCWRQDTLAQAYRRHGGGVFGLARRLRGDRQSAKDIVDEAFSRLGRQPEPFDPARGWLRSYPLAQTQGRSVAAPASVPEPERRAVTPADRAGNPYRDVARLLGKPEGTGNSRIGSRLHRLRLTVARPGMEGT